MGFDSFMDKVVWGPQDAVRDVKGRFKDAASVPKRKVAEVVGRKKPGCETLGHKPPKGGKKRGKGIFCQRDTCGAELL